MTGWSVDYKRSGYIDRVEIRLKGWSSYYQATAGYITGCQWYKGDGFFKGLSTGYWDNKIPDLENVMLAKRSDSRLGRSLETGLRLSDIGYGKWKNSPVKYSQVYPVNAMIEYNEVHAPDRRTSLSTVPRRMSAYLRKESDGRQEEAILGNQSPSEGQAPGQQEATASQKSS